MALNFDSIRKQRESMSAPSMTLDKKSWTQKTLRLLPIANTELARMKVDIYSESLRLGTTSPLTWNQPCPISDYMTKAKHALAKADMEDLRKTMKVSTTYMLLCIDRADPGESGAPNVRIFDAGQQVYQAITDYLLADPENPEDLTDFLEGRDIIVKKTGQGMQTEWTVPKFCDRSAISDDEVYVESLRRYLDGFDIEGQLYRTDWAKLGQIYKAATGDDIDPAYTQGAEPAPKPVNPPATQKAAAAPVKAAPVKPSAPAKVPVKAPVKAAPAPAPAPEPEPEVIVADESDENGVTIGKTKVLMNYGDEAPKAGLITAREESGDYEVTLDVEVDGNTVFTAMLSDIQIVEEPKPVAAKAKPTPVKPAPAKPSAVSKVLAARRP